MDQRAKVRSVDALRDFHTSLVSFVDKARPALLEIDMSVQKFQYWLGTEQKAYWQRELRKRQEYYNWAKQELQRRKNQGGANASHKPDTTEQEQNLRVATMKLREAEEKLQAIHRWTHTVDKAVEEYKAKSRRLADMVQGSPPEIVGRMGQVIAAVERYLETQMAVTGGPTGTAPASGPSEASAGSSSSEAAPEAAPADAGASNAPPSADADSAETTDAAEAESPKETNEEVEAAVRENAS